MLTLLEWVLHYYHSINGTYVRHTLFINAHVMSDLNHM